MGIKVTMSALPRFMACRGSASLPHVRTVEDSDTRRGTVLHEFVLLGKAPPAEFREECQALDLSAAPDGFTTEVAYAYDPNNDAGHLLGRELGRAYPEWASELICGTADWVRVDADSVTILDLKTGRTSLSDARWQLVGLALAACRWHGKSSATIGLGHIIDGVLVWGARETLDAMDLAAAAEEIRGAVDSAPSQDLVEGPHCGRCPAFAACRAKQALAASLVGLPELRLDNESIPRILQAVEHGERVLKEVRAAVREYVTHNPVQLPDGSVLAMQEVARESIDAEKARAVLPMEVWEAAVETKMSKTALDAALREACPKRGYKAEVYAQLRAAGAITTSTHQELRKVKPKSLPAETEGAQQ